MIHRPSYGILLRSPELTRHLNGVSVYLFELVCLMVARDGEADFVWNVPQQDMERD